MPLSPGGNAFAQLGQGFTLIALGGDKTGAPVTAFRAAADKAGLPLHVITDSFDGPRAAYRQPLILVRPDQFVAWAGEEVPADPAALLRRVAGHPEG